MKRAADIAAEARTRRVATTDALKVGSLISHGTGSTAVELRMRTTSFAAAFETTWRIQANGLSIVNGPRELLLVVRLWEGGFVTYGLIGGNVNGVDGVEQLGPKGDVLGHDGRVAELLDETVLALNGGIRNFAELVGRDTRPRLVDSSLEEGNNELWTNKVDKGVTDVAAVGEVHADVQEVVVTFAGDVEDLLDIFEAEAVGKVADHEGSADISAVFDGHDLNVLRLASSVNTLTTTTWTGHDVTALAVSVHAVARSHGRHGRARRVVGVGVHGAVRHGLDRVVVGWSRGLAMLRRDKLVTDPSGATGG